MRPEFDDEGLGACDSNRNETLNNTKNAAPLVKKPERTWSVCRFVSALFLLSGFLCCLGGCGAGGNSGADSNSSPIAQPAPTGTVVVSVFPPSAYLVSGDTQLFNATVTGSSNTAVTWSVVELQNGGAISTTGIFSAPNNAGTYHVLATSRADASKSAMATVTVPTTATVQSGFTLLRHMTQPRAAHTATLLPNGKVLIVDGGYLDIDDLLVSIAGVELFDPSSESFTPMGQSFVTREFHTATLLPNGQVLITGGNEFDGYPTSLLPTATAELYDPASGLFVTTASMAVGRSGHTATLLADGRVLVVGGSSDSALSAALSLALKFTTL